MEDKFSKYNLFKLKSFDTVESHGISRSTWNELMKKPYLIVTYSEASKESVSSNESYSFFKSAIVPILYSVKVQSELQVEFVLSKFNRNTLIDNSDKGDRLGPYKEKYLYSHPGRGWDHFGPAEENGPIFSFKKFLSEHRLWEEWKAFLKKNRNSLTEEQSFEFKVDEEAFENYIEKPWKESFRPKLIKTGGSGFINPEI